MSMRTRKWWNTKQHASTQHGAARDTCRANNGQQNAGKGKQKVADVPSQGGAATGWESAYAYV